MVAPLHPVPKLLDVSGVSKRFPGVQALEDVHLTLSRGEVLAVIGENGAGKSTLMKILAGVETPDRGEIRVDGQLVSIADTGTAKKLGIALIHQELNLADNLDVASNIFLGREPHQWGFVDRHRLYSEAHVFLEQVGLNCSPRLLLSELPLGCRQLVEIARALSAQARILIMDEPTSSLSQGETEQLYSVVNDLRNRGVGIVYISHRLREVKQLADRVVVLRDGRNAGMLVQEQIAQDAMVSLMVGRALVRQVRTSQSDGAPLLEVQDLRTTAHPQQGLSFQVRVGEIVGLAGLVGAGRTELLQVLFGIDQAVSGTVRLGGQVLHLQSPGDAIAAGLALVPEDRKLQGVILEMSVGRNATLASLHRDARCGFLNTEQEMTQASMMTQQLRVKTPSIDHLVQYLSGGNQQKVVLAKWLALKPRVLLLDEPTRGIDVGAKQEIYRLMEELASQGIGILFVSSELDEILRMSDRALVMHQGRLAGVLDREQLSEESIMQLATGTPHQMATSVLQELL